MPVLTHCRAAVVGFCLPDQRRACSNKPALLRELEPARPGMELTQMGAEQQDPSSQSCRLRSAVLRARPAQLSKAEHLFILCFCIPGSKHCFCPPTWIERHPLFPTAAKFTISRLLSAKCENLQELPPALCWTHPCQCVEQSEQQQNKAQHKEFTEKFCQLQQVRPVPKLLLSQPAPALIRTKKKVEPEQINHWNIN